MHQNLIKRFHARDIAHVALVAMKVSMIPEDKLAKVDLTHLKNDQRVQLKTLLDRFRTIFDPDHGFTTVG